MEVEGGGALCFHRFPEPFTFGAAHRRPPCKKSIFSGIDCGCWAAPRTASLRVSGQCRPPPGHHLSCRPALTRRRPITAVYGFSAPLLPMYYSFADLHVTQSSDYQHPITRFLTGTPPKSSAMMYPRPSGETTERPRFKKRQILPFNNKLRCCDADVTPLLSIHSRRCLNNIPRLLFILDTLIIRHILCCCVKPKRQ